MTSHAILLSEHTLSRFVIDVLGAVGVPQTDGAIVANCLVTANLSGIDSHGVIRLAHYVERLENGTIKTHPQLTFTQTAPAMGILDGGEGLGHVVAYQATTHAMALAAETGAGLVAVGNSSHFGMAGFYVLRMIEQGFAGISMTATDRMLVPFGARKPFFGTNPICFGFPSAGIPVVLDMSTTGVAYGKVALAALEGRPIPDTWGLDADGNPTTNPKAIAGLHPAAGYKGSGLAMVIDIFCSLLAGMPWGPHINRMYAEMDGVRHLGHFLMAIDVSRFLPLAHFQEQLQALVQELTTLEPAAGVEQVYYPGQIEGIRRAQRRAEGIPIEPGLASELAALGERYRVPFPPA